MALSLGPLARANMNNGVVRGDANAVTLGKVGLDALGLSMYDRKRKAQQLALTNPGAYITARNNAIDRLENEIAIKWANTFSLYSVGRTQVQADNIGGGAQPITAEPESIAKMRADAEATALWDAGMDIINLEYPLTAVAAAVENSKSKNERDLAGNVEHIIESAVSTKKLKTPRIPGATRKKKKENK